MLRIWARGAVLAGTVNALVLIGAPAHGEVPPPSTVPGTTVIALGAGYSRAIAADPGSGTVVLDSPDRHGAQVRDSAGTLVATLLGDDEVAGLVFDPGSGLYWAALPLARQLASINPVTLETHRVEVPAAAGCPQDVAMADGLVVFISPFAVGDGCQTNDGIHAYDPATGTVHVALAQSTHGDLQRMAAAGGPDLYVYESVGRPFLAAFDVVGGPTPSIRERAVRELDGAARNLAVDPDTGDVLVGGSRPDHEVLTTALADAPTEPQGMYHVQVVVAAGSGGLSAYSPWAYGSHPGDPDLYIYRDDQSQPAAQYDLGRFSIGTDSDEIDALAFGTHLYALTDIWDGDQGSSFSYLRVFDIPSSPIASSPDPPASVGASTVSTSSTAVSSLETATPAIPVAPPARVARPTVRVIGPEAQIRWRAPSGGAVACYRLKIDGRWRRVPASVHRLALRHVQIGRHVVRVTAVGESGSSAPSRAAHFRVVA